MNIRQEEALALHRRILPKPPEELTAEEIEEIAQLANLEMLHEKELKERKHAVYLYDGDVYERHNHIDIHITKVDKAYGLRVGCGLCDGTFIIYSWYESPDKLLEECEPPSIDNKVKCPHCGEILDYPEGAEW